MVHVLPPDSDAAHRAIACQVELQPRAGGNANIGRAAEDDGVFCYTFFKGVGRGNQRDNVISERR